ncbi:hypothetical protein [Streptosporangium sp. NPDC001681]|uniref:hypothetical protein n=1 Tax=Streptosporangium sp. NPDC001681 TaxID=3154395 RepID=UPI00332C190F
MFVVMIGSMRRVARCGGVAFALCLTVLGIVVLIHLALYVAAHAHAAHHHAPGVQTVTSVGDSNTETPSAVAAVSHEHAPCPRLPADHDHRLCGAATGAQITDVRPLPQTGPAVGDPMITEVSATLPPPPAQRSSRPVCPPPGAVLLVLKSVSRI